MLGMIQTESPYYQPVPPAPELFTPGLFPGDPDFSNYTSTSTTCAFSWGMRILDSSSVHLLGAGISICLACILSDNNSNVGFYSWFSDYSQDCMDKDYCQDCIFQIKQSYNVWIYNLITKAALEMVSPVAKSQHTPRITRTASFPLYSPGSEGPRRWWAAASFGASIFGTLTRTRTRMCLRAF